jgi:tyrosyl-tRNA synthetase
MSTIKATPSEQMQEIKRGIFEIIPEDELVKKITKSYESQKPMIIKFGADPSREKRQWVDAGKFCGC